MKIRSCKLICSFRERKQVPDMVLEYVVIDSSSYRGLFQKRDCMLLKSLQFILLLIKDLLWPKYVLSRYLKELPASGGNNKEPEDDRKGRSEEGITGKFPSGTDNGAPPLRMNRS